MTSLPLSLTPAPGLRNSTVQIPATKPEAPEHRKLRKAAQDFEGILLSAWWQQMQKSFLGPSDAEREAGADTLSSLAIQSMSSALAHQGGLGLAQMLVRQLEPSLHDT